MYGGACQHGGVDNDATAGPWSDISERHQRTKHFAFVCSIFRRPNGWLDTELLIHVLIYADSDKEHTIGRLSELEGGCFFVMHPPPPTATAVTPPSVARGIALYCIDCPELTTSRPLPLGLLLRNP
jgi:hypothetical protein